MTLAGPSLKKALTIGLIPGDGIGKLVIPAAQRVLQHTPGLPKLSFVPLEAGFELFTRTGVSLPQQTVEKLRNECDSALFGAVSSPSHKVEGYSSPIVKLRKELDLYANIRPIHSVARKLEITVVRENTECLYVKQESMSSSDPFAPGKVARAIRVISQRASERIGRMAAEVALRGLAVRSQIAEPDRIWKGPPKVTIVHKSNVLSVSDGLFRESVRSVFESHAHDSRFDQIVVEEGIVDSLIYNLYRTPERFNVLVCPNLYGDIVSDAGAALVGSLGLVPSVNAGDNFIMGEPVHGSAPDILHHTPPIANPIAAIRSAALMLEYLGFTNPAASIYNAVNQVLTQGNVLTPDLGGKSSTDQVTEAVMKEIK
ncbi:hypothetical protein O181_078804 [Austropuccinia psidii MF-1]|uniref:Isopropylmalate dehydrogenase-like domain-containing protein n=1 Tax=Austropuccinia psidii MF-1 TaxID=1389203 RepID=A0A9Q3FHM0_9BASI|nr:hypothetical protein [Austropuccinia psidii MF-1]